MLTIAAVLPHGNLRKTLVPLSLLQKLNFTPRSEC